MWLAWWNDCEYTPLWTISVWMSSILVIIRAIMKGYLYKSNKSEGLPICLSVSFIHSLPEFNLLRIGAFDVTHATQDCWERKLTLDHIHTFFTIQGNGGPPWMMVQLNAGPPPRQHKHERRYTSSTYLFILTRRIWKNDYDGQMIFGDPVGLKLPVICLTGEEKPRKNLTQQTCPNWGSNPGLLCNGRTCYLLLHSGGLSVSSICKKRFNLKLGVIQIKKKNMRKFS